MGPLSVKVMRFNFMDFQNTRMFSVLMDSHFHLSSVELLFDCAMIQWNRYFLIEGQSNSSQST